MKATFIPLLLLFGSIANSQDRIEKLLLESNSALCYSIDNGKVNNDLAPELFFGALNNYFIDSLSGIDIDVYKASTNLDSICSTNNLLEIYNEDLSQRITISNANSFGSVRDKELKFINYKIKAYFVNLYDSKSNIVFLTCTLDNNSEYIVVPRNNEVDFNKIQKLGKYIISNAASL